VALIGALSAWIAFTAGILGIARLGASHVALLSGQEPLWTALFSFALLGIVLAPARILAAVFGANRFALEGGGGERQTAAALSRR